MRVMFSYHKGKKRCINKHTTNHFKMSS